MTIFFFIYTYIFLLYLYFIIKVIILEITFYTSLIFNISNVYFTPFKKKKIIYENLERKKEIICKGKKNHIKF